jgi:hypothetical protein
MPKTLIIAVFGTLLMLCIGAQIFSLNRATPDNGIANNYYYIH